MNKNHLPAWLTRSDVYDTVMLLKNVISPQVADKNDDELLLQASVNHLRIGMLNQNELQLKGV